MLSAIIGFLLGTGFGYTFHEKMNYVKANKTYSLKGKWDGYVHHDKDRMEQRKENQREKYQGLSRDE